MRQRWNALLRMRIPGVRRATAASSLDVAIDDLVRDLEFLKQPDESGGA
jgi:hypothetical protein